MTKTSPAQPGLESLSKSFEPAALEAHWGPEWEKRGYGIAGFRGTQQPQADAPGALRFSCHRPMSRALYTWGMRLTKPSWTV